MPGLNPDLPPPWNYLAAFDTLAQNEQSRNTFLRGWWDLPQTEEQIDVIVTVYAYMKKDW